MSTISSHSNNFSYFSNSSSKPKSTIYLKINLHIYKQLKKNKFKDVLRKIHNAILQIKCNV
jgi:hypothetical protein